MKIDSKAIRQLADLLEETGLTEIEVAEGDQMIRVNKGGAMVAPQSSAVSVPNQANMATDPTIKGAPNTQMPSPVAGDHPGAVTSPMVGTVYMAAEPSSPSFVKKGDTVKAGDTLLIIEAMKVMNPIKAPKGGVVQQILAENGKPVEYGDVLMIIE